MTQSAHLDRWNALHGAVGRLTAAASLDDAVEVIRDSARRIAAADGVTVIRRIGDHVHYIAEDSISPLWAGRDFPIDQCISGLAMTLNKPVIIPDIQHDPRVPLNLYLSTFVQSMAMFPVGMPTPTAAIGAYWRTPQPIEGKTILLLSTLARALGDVFDMLAKRDAAAADLARLPRAS